MDSNWILIRHLSINSRLISTASTTVAEATAAIVDAFREKTGAKVKGKGNTTAKATPKAKGEGDSEG